MNNTKVWHGFSLDDLFIICRGNAKNINSKKDEGDVSLISPMAQTLQLRH